MSTEINIRKRIDIQEEGVSITPDVSSINFTGAGVTASAVGQDVTVDLSIQPTYFADLTTTEALKPCTYNNGISGVGATLTGNISGQLATVSYTDRIDNVVTALGQVILVRLQASAIQNGLYVVTQLGDGSSPFILTRSTDADTTAELFPLQVNVYFGTVFANLYFYQKTVNPIIGTSNITFAQANTGVITTPTIFVDTVTSTALPACTYTSGTNTAIPGIGARLTANVNGALGAINGITLVAGNRILVKDEVNQATNGDYTVTQVGSGSTPFILTRISTFGSEFVRYTREWKVNNSASTNFGARYNTDLLSLANTNVGITNLIFQEVYSVPTTRNITINGTTQDLSADRTYTVTDDNLSTSDITTNDVSTAKHGFAPKAPNDTAKFLRGDGTWAVPASGSASGIFGIANTSGVYTFYSTITLAMAAAVAGQTIEVFADITVTTATTYTLKDGVHINGNGHTFTNTHNTTSFNVFTDGGGNVSCNIINYRIVRNGTSSNGGNTINLQGTGTFDFTGTQIIRLANSDFGLCIGISNTVTVTNLYASSERGQVFNCISSSASFINCYFRQVSGSSSCGSNQGTMLGCTVLAQITTALSITGAAYVANCYINSGTGQAVTIIGGELVNSSCVSTTNYAVNISGGEVINCHIRSNSQNALFMGGGIVTQCRILTASAASINGNATVVRLYQSDVFCQWNDVNGHGIQRPLDVHQNRIRVSNLSAKGLFSSVAANTSYSQNQFVGPSTYSAPVSATITQTIINTEDNQGNLVI